MKTALNFPFTAIVGQPLFKLALILSAINPAVGGVLVSGPRGSAKSTLARSLADIIPLSDNSKPAPFITLPLGATEEMLVGTLNLQDVLNKQQLNFKQGLLAKANSGVLYVDEVNLLADNLVDSLLDVAASGTNVVERDGVSHSHRAQFLLLGSMNPDEGELRPQLQDRFGFSVHLRNEYSLDERIAIVKRREAFDTNKQGFIEAYKTQQETLKASIIRSKNILPSITCSEKLRVVIAERCQQANVEGLRADILWYRAALAHAAWQVSQPVDKALENKFLVTLKDIDAVEDLVLAHRRQSPPNNTSKGSDNTQEAQQHSFTRPSSSYSGPSTGENSPLDSTQKQERQGDWGQMQAQQQLSATMGSQLLEEHLKKPPTKAKHHLGDKQSPLNRHQHRVKKGFNTSSLIKIPANKGRLGAINSTSIDWFRSFIANIGQWPLKQLCYRPAKVGRPVSHLILLDTSASTLHNKLLADAKSAVLSIAKIAYLKRQQLTILGFGNQQVTTLLPQTKSPKQLRQRLDAVTASGGTPLCDVLDSALALQQKQHRQLPELMTITYLITDGRTTQNFEQKRLLGKVLVIDTEKAPVKRGRGQSIAKTLQADYMPLFA